MDLRALTYFVTAVERGSITAAAKHCHVAQPSITHAIAQLESEFGITFLIRSKKGVRTTTQGEAFYQQAQGLLQHANNIRDQFSSVPQNSLNLYVAKSISAGSLSRCFRLLSQRCSAVSWVLVEDQSGSDVRLVNAQQLSSDEQWLPLFEEQYHVLLPNAYALAQQAQVSIEELSLLPCIERAHCEFRQSFSQFAPAQGGLNVVATADNEDRALALVSAGIGFTIMPLSPGQTYSGITAITLNRFAGVPALRRELGVAFDRRSVFISEALGV